MRPTITIDHALLKDVKKRLGEMERKAPQAVSSALNRALSKVATNINREVRSRYNLKARDVRETLSDIRATRADLQAIVKSKGILIPLDRFKVSPKRPAPKRKSPIKVAVKKGGIKPIRGAFVADINGIKVFRRQDKERTPIDRLFGPSVPQMLDNEETRNKINEEGREEFYRRLDHEINRILDRGAS